MNEIRKIVGMVAAVAAIVSLTLELFGERPAKRSAEPKGK